MKLYPSKALIVSLLLVLPAVSHGADKSKSEHNEHMYPPAAAAKPFINFDGAGFIIDGQRTVISSGSIHYPRVPHELWADRFLRMKQGSFNCVETYAFWNLSEPRENEWNFAGDADIGAFLDTAKQQGLYATVRVGPYVCAEWDFGGWPIWLKFKPAMNVRTDDPAYLALNDHWYDKIFSVIAPHQINHGGNVIMVQLENEHPKGWGVITDQPYFVHLSDTAVKDGLEVPYFMSGLNHGGSPSPGNLDPATRTNPWYTTESWAGWFDAYGTLHEKKLREVDNAQWNILAHGGGGYNFYMIHGGTNFQTWNDDSVGASYDYGAAIGQAGDLRPMYYKMKRVNQLAQSFPAILADSSDALPEYKDFASGAGVSVIGARKSPAGTFVFLRNSRSAPAEAMFNAKAGLMLTLSRYGTYPLPRDVVLADGVKVRDATLPVLAMAKNGNATTLVIYGEPGEIGYLTLATEQRAALASSTPGIAVDFIRPQAPTLTVTIPAAGIEECNLDLGSKSVRVLAINRDLSLYTWLVGPAGKQFVVLGPEFVRAVKENQGQLAVVIERYFGQPAPGQVAVYGEKGKSWHLAPIADTALDDSPAPTLAGWEQSVVPLAEAKFDDSQWPRSEQPMEMGANGNTTAFCWYRTTIDLPAAGSGKISFKANDNAELFVNGHPVSDRANADFMQGKNTIAFFVSHHGRNKAFSYLGSLVHYGDKGLIETPVLEIQGKKIKLTGWHQQGGAGEDPAAITDWTALPDHGSNSGFPTFFRAHFTAKPPAELGAYPILRATFAGLSRGTMWINGHNLGRYPEKIRIDSLYVPECWLDPGGKNTLTVFDEEGANPSQVKIVVEKAASREVLEASEPIAATTPLVVPQENPPRDLAKMNQGNLAFGRAATASASKKGSPPENATDGDVETAWSPPDKTRNDWLQVDLGEPTSVKICEIIWGGPAKNYHYTLEGSADASHWRPLGDNTTAVPTSADSPSELSRLNLTGDPVRYLRVNTPNSGSGVAVTEVRAFAADK
jgi:beta-galactosidase